MSVSGVSPPGLTWVRRPKRRRKGKGIMAAALRGLVGHLQRGAEVRRDGGPSDRQLLERFASRRDEAAFAELVRRHGPMVLGVARRVLHDAHDAEDVFQ